MNISIHALIIWISLIILLHIPHTGFSINYKEPEWKVKCENDPFTGRSCYAEGKWIQYPVKSKPLVVLLIVYAKSHDGTEGIFFDSSPSHYPAKPFMIKIDDHKPITGISKVEAEGIFVRQQFPHLFDQIRTGKIMLLRYYTWPEGVVDATIDITGFQDAIDEAQSKMNKLK